MSLILLIPLTSCSILFLRSLIGGQQILILLDSLISIDSGMWYNLRQELVSICNQSITLSVETRIVGLHHHSYAQHI